MTKRRDAAGCLSVLLCVGGVNADDGVTIGRHSPGVGGAAPLHAHVDLPQPVGLVPSVFPGFTGFATGQFGFSNTPIDHEDEDLYMLAAAADISAFLTDLGGSLVVNNGLHVMTPGDAMHFGVPYFDYHPLFQLPSGGSGFARFVLRDASGTYADSDAFVLNFFAVNPTCPADLGAQGGVLGADLHLDNNDFVVFVDRFFARDPLADRGVQGGLPGSDAEFDNNDFVVFVDQFFDACGG